MQVESDVKISVFDILVEKVIELVYTQMSVGTNTLNFNASNFASGIYIYRIDAKSLSGLENFITVKKNVTSKIIV